MFSNFLSFNYWNFDIGMFLLRSPISIQLSKKIFGMISKNGVQINMGDWKNNSEINKQVGGGSCLFSSQEK